MFAFCITCFSRVAQASSLLIEKNTADSGGGVYFTGGAAVAQSFTTLSNQYTVTEVGLQIYAPVGETFTLILSTSATVTDSSKWLYNTLFSGYGSVYWYLMMTSTTYVTPSTTYYIIAWSGSNTDEIFFDTGNLYTGGALMYCPSGGSWTTYSTWDTNLRVYGDTDNAPNLPTVTSGAHTVPLNENDMWAFAASDPDLSASLQYAINWDGTTYGAWTDFTNEVNSGGQTIASVNLWHTYTSGYNGNIQFKVRDQFHAVSPICTYSINAYDHAPVLTGASVDPQSGSHGTVFTFYVTYYDDDGEAPGNKVCYYEMPGSSWSNQQMTKYGGNYLDGAYYDLDSPAATSDGTGHYYFSFDDGHGNTVRLPSGSGDYTFTVSTNNAPNVISVSDISCIPTSFYRGQVVTFSAKTTDPDGNQIKYGWDWNLTGTVNRWTGYYNSGSYCSITHTYGYNDFDGVGGQSLPSTVRVKASDGSLDTVFTAAPITMLNHAPNATTIHGLSSIGNNTLNTWNLTQIDWETDQMKVTFSWGDGSSSLTTGWNISGHNTSASHTYTSRGQKTITCTITDEFGGASSIYCTVTVEDVPQVPSNIQSTVLSQGIHVYWNKPVDDGGKPATVYGIKWWNASKAEATATFIYGIPFTNASDYSGTGYVIAGLTNGIKYDFRMSCNNTYGKSAWSQIHNNTPGHTSPTIPTISPLAQFSGTSFDLSWSAPTFYDGAILSKYYILNSTNNIVYSALANTTSRTYHISGLTSGVTYYYKVYVVDNKSGQSGNSNYVYTIIDSVSPTEPILNSITTYTYSLTTNVSWSASTDLVSGLDYYTIQEDTSTSFSSPVSVYESNSLYHVFTLNHAYSKTYYYRIRATDKAGNPSIWDGPIQTMLKINGTNATGSQYSKISEIWFHSNSIQINIPVYVTITVENTYLIPPDDAVFTVGGIDTVMTLSEATISSYKFSGTWTPTTSGSVDFNIKVTNQNGAVNSITVPVEVLTTPTTQKASVKVFESGGNVIVSTFSDSSRNVSSYKDSLNEYHVTFGTSPTTDMVVDLTNLQPTLVPGYIWFIRVSFLDSQQLKCVVHGDKQVVDYKIKPTYKVSGYNDWKSKYFGWILGKKYTLLETTNDYIELSSLEKEIVCKV